MTCLFLSHSIPLQSHAKRNKSGLCQPLDLVFKLKIWRFGVDFTSEGETMINNEETHRLHLYVSIRFWRMPIPCLGRLAQAIVRCLNSVGSSYVPLLSK